MKITTRKMQPTDTRGERVRGRCNGRTLTVAWDYALNTQDMHRKVAEMLADEPVKLFKPLETGYVWLTVTEERDMDRVLA